MALTTAARASPIASYLNAFIVRGVTWDSQHRALGTRAGCADIFLIPVGQRSS
jgi:hypothetical protein